MGLAQDAHGFPGGKTCEPGFSKQYRYDLFDKFRYAGFSVNLLGYFHQVGAIYRLVIAGKRDIVPDGRTVND
jgi:hypothetical protein